jgi:outer membrane receptor protein involved in Fe transport
MLHARIWAVLGIGCLITGTLAAQAMGGGTVSGILTSKSTGRPLDFANVVLRSKTDTSMVKGTNTDGTGKFIFSGIPAGGYFVDCGFIGYRTFRSYVFAIDARHLKIDLGTIPMAESALAGDEVDVTAEKALFNNTIDRKVYNVDKDIMSKTGTVSELLQNIPSVLVDIDGNVSLRGSGDVMILINGRPSPLMGKSRAAVLQQMPANSVEKIEVITNPSARYRPDGTSGIINIVLKKETKSGLNGSATANAGTRRRHNENLSFNYNPGKLNLFGSAGYRQDDRNRFGTDVRELTDESSGSLSHYVQDDRSAARPHSVIGNLGLAYNFDAVNSLELSGNYFSRKMTRNDISNRVTRDGGGLIIRDYDRLRLADEPETETEATAAFLHKFGKEDHELRVELKASDAPENEDNHFTEVYRVPEDSRLYDNTLIKQGEKQEQVTVEYVNPLSEETKLEAGYDGEFTRQDLDFLAETFDAAAGKFVRDAAKSNRFLFDQGIHAVYGTYAGSFGRLGFLGGVRSEVASVKSHLITGDSIIHKDYFSFFPTLHLAYRLSKTGEIQLNYSRRVNRPEADELNPFPEYADPRNIQAGNPNLRPENIHSVEFGLQYQNEHFSFIPSVYYRYKVDGFTSITKVIDDSTLLRTIENLSSDRSTGFETIVSASAGRFLTGNLNANVFYNRIDASNIGYGREKSIVSWSGTLSLNVNPARTTMLQINSNYRSARLTPQGEYYPSVVFNLGIRQDLFMERVSLILTASDVFKSQRQEMKLNIPGLNQHVTNKRDSRVIYLGMTWHFGKPEKKSKEKTLQYDDRI